MFSRSMLSGQEPIRKFRDRSRFWFGTSSSSRFFRTRLGRVLPPTPTTRRVQNRLPGDEASHEPATHAKAGPNLFLTFSQLRQSSAAYHRKTDGVEAAFVLLSGVEQRKRQDAGE